MLQSDLSNQMGQYAAYPEARYRGKNLHDELLTRGDAYLQTCYRQVHSKMRSRWNESERDFWAQVDTAKIEEMKKRGIPTFEEPFVLPLMSTYIDSIAAAQLQIIVERDPRIEISSRLPDQEEEVENAELLLNMHYQRSRMDWVWWQRLLHTHIYGFSPRATFWDNVKQINATYAWDPFLFFWDPARPVTDIHRGRFIAFQSTSDRLEMKQQGIYFNLDKLKGPDAGYLKTFGYGVERDTFGTVRNSIFGLTDSAYQQQSFRETVKRIEPYIAINHTIYFKMIPAEWPEIKKRKLWLPEMDPEEPTIAVMTISNGKTVTRFDYSDFKHGQFPAGVISAYSDGQVLVPPGATEINRGPHRYANWLASSRKDTVQKVLNSRGIFDPEKLDLEDLNNPHPGQNIPLRPEAYGKLEEAYMPLKVQDTTQSHLQDLDYMRNLMERQTGSTEPIQGTMPEREQKATIFSIITRAAQGRHGIYVRLYEEQDAADHIAQMLANAKEFMAGPVWIRLNASTAANRKSDPRRSSHVQIFPDDLKNVEADYVPFSAKELTFREKRADILSEWLKMILSMGPDVIGRFDLFEILLDIPRYAGERNVDKYLKSIEPQQALPAPAGMPQMQGPAPPVPMPPGPPGPGPGQPPAPMPMPLQPMPLAPPVPVNGGMIPAGVGT